MAYWNFEYTKAVIYTVVKVGGGIGQDPATEVTNLRLNQPPAFSSVQYVASPLGALLNAVHQDGTRTTQEARSSA